MSPARFSGTIARLGHPSPVKLIRFGPGSYENGRFVAGEQTELEITASVQPASGRDLQRLPEGQSTRETISVWSPAELRTATDAAGASADRIEWQGRVYEVQLVEPWAPGQYWRAVAAKVD